MIQQKHAVMIMKRNDDEEVQRKEMKEGNFKKRRVKCRGRRSQQNDFYQLWPTQRSTSTLAAGIQD
jgi:hypothetical protein